MAKLSPSLRQNQPHRLWALVIQGKGESPSVAFSRQGQLPTVAKIHLFHAFSFHWLGLRPQEEKPDLVPIFRAFPPYLKWWLGAELNRRFDSRNSATVSKNAESGFNVGGYGLE
jgi:hypothetical protein